jgi:hypothetical protein
LTLSTGLGSVTFPDNMLSSLTGLTLNSRYHHWAGRQVEPCRHRKRSYWQPAVIKLTLTLDGIQTAWNNPNRTVQSHHSVHAFGGRNLKIQESFLSGIWTAAASRSAYRTVITTCHVRDVQTLPFQPVRVGYIPVTFRM